MHPESFHNFNTKFNQNIIKECFDLFVYKNNLSKEDTTSFGITLYKDNTSIPKEVKTLDELLGYFDQIDNYNNIFFAFYINKNKIKNLTNHSRIHFFIYPNNKSSINIISESVELNLFIINFLKQKEIEIEKPPIKIFIGHGGVDIWENLATKISSKKVNNRELKTLSFESNKYCGADNYSIAYNSIKEAEFAVILMLAEDEMKNDEWRARDNVLHEIGLAQGLKGPDKTIILFDAKLPSNISGLNHIKIDKDKLDHAALEVKEAIEKYYNKTKEIY
jgi:predicted nucleotide-binding protein